MDKRKAVNQNQALSGAGRPLAFGMIALGVLLVAAAVLLLLAHRGDAASLGPARKGAQFGNFTLSDVNGKQVQLSDYAGRPVLINAWATWCPPCKEEMPTLNAYYQDHRQDGFVVVAIEDGEPLADVAAYARDHGLTFPVWPDLKWVATTAFKTDALPSSFVIDRTGRVVLSWTGPITRASLEKYVTPLIARQ